MSSVTCERFALLTFTLEEIILCKSVLWLRSVNDPKWASMHLGSALCYCSYYTPRLWAHAVLLMTKHWRNEKSVQTPLRWWAVCIYPAASAAEGSWQTGCSCEPVRWDLVCERSCHWGRRPDVLSSAAAAWPAETALPTSLRRAQQGVNWFNLIFNKSTMPPGEWVCTLQEETQQTIIQHSDFEDLLKIL